MIGMFRPVCLLDEKAFRTIWEYMQNKPDAPIVQGITKEYLADTFGGYTDSNFYHYCERNVDWNAEETVNRYGVRLVKIYVQE